ncbi:hypothetical protein R1flu_027974 [Riccia fluitans]|uniref:Reverse transcriptase zinc-binding domain-containing protein n=1 Tax=Riccia fluitans TaxID=41844 RepID=A0ABD1XNA8_9MARC
MGVAAGLCLFCKEISEDVPNLFFCCRNKIGVWIQVIRDFPILEEFVRCCVEKNLLPESLNYLAALSKGKLFSFLLLSKLLRCIWYQGCVLFFEERTSDIVLGTVIIQVAESHLVVLHSFGG